MSEGEAQIDLTVLVCTYNRADDLSELLESVLAQPTDGRFEYEVFVVDNNSSDRTRAAVEALIARGSPRLRYQFEGRQGKSFALNTGLASARGEIVAIIDDDQLMPPGYLIEMMAAFRGQPEVAFIGGKVLPIWEEEPPSWLTPQHWGPIGMADYGDEPIKVNEHRAICLLTCAFRIADLRSVGGFRLELGVTGSDAIGGIEDAEIQERLWRSGRPGLYLPALVLRHRAPRRRLTHAHFLRWHRGHGRFRALHREVGAEHSRAWLFDVPGYIYRQALLDLFGWLGNMARGRSERAFDNRARLCFFKGFFQQRYAAYQNRADIGPVREITRFLKQLAGTERE